MAAKDEPKGSAAEQSSLGKLKVCTGCNGDCRALCERATFYSIPYKKRMLKRR